MKNNSCSSSKLGKFAEKRPRREGSVDRLSNLPGSVLYHILSFIDTEKTVRTSVLSRRWRCVWKHVPALHFNSLDQTYKRFTMFVDKVLSLRYPTNVDKVSYSHVDYYEESDDDEDEYEDKDHYDPLLRVVEYAISHQTRHLKLDLRDDGSNCEWYEFPQSCASINNCNLESLCLVRFVIDDRFQSVGLRLLTTLELFDCRFEYDWELLDPFSKFPCLKNLFLHDNTLDDGFRLRIAGLELHSLELHHMDFADFEICAPKLKSFRVYKCWMAERFYELAFPSLEYAYIEDCFHFHPKPTKENMFLMLQAFHNVTSLTIGIEVVKVLCEDLEFLEQQPSPFTRLENLNMTAFTKKKIPYKLVSYFLKETSCGSPNIKIF
ncbi:Putative F-box/LRR-repeat protein At5g02930 [Linum perenne]